MKADWIEIDVQIGDVLTIDGDLIGEVTKVFYDEDGDAASCVLKLANDEWAAVDFSRCRPTSVRELGIH